MFHGTYYNGDRIGSLLYNPIEQPGCFDPLSNDPNPDSNSLTRLPSSSTRSSRQPDIYALGFISSF